MAFTIVYQDYQKNSCNYHSEEFNEINPNTAQAKKKEEYLRNLLDRISNYRFIAFTHYITDILQVISNLSLESQKENINYSPIYKSIEVCVNKIKENYVREKAIWRKLQNILSRI